MKFCTHCGEAIVLKVPESDNRERHVCGDCGTIHYQNPKIIAGCLITQNDQVLLCRRAIEPRLGFWTLPAGFMENEETTGQAAARETLEEACARVEIGSLFAVVNVPHINQVHLFYLGKLVDGRHSPGEESLETALLQESDIPWHDLAFRSVRFALERYYADKRAGHFRLHSLDLPPPPADYL